MGLIYKIYNDINDKLYIGQTQQTLIRRWQEHLCDSKKTDTHLYRAMRKYGTEHFMIEIIEKDIPPTQLDEREKYWIQFYDSYINGYNSTPGGMTTTNFDTIPIFQYSLDGYLLNRFDGANEAERKTGCLHQNILKACKGILRQCGGFLWNFEEFERLEMRPSKVTRQVGQYDENNNLIQVFDMVKDAAKEIGVEPTHISRACKSKYKCHGYYWKYMDENLTN